MTVRSLLSLTLLAFACAAPAAAVGPPHFTYNRTLPLSVRVLARYRRGPVSVRSVSFAVDGSFRAMAYIVSSRVGHRQPGIVFAPGRWQTRNYFLAEAIDEASRGAIAVSLDDLSNGYPSFTSSDRLRLTRRVVALRRAIDLLSAQPRIDRARLAFVGHSDGAELGGMLAGIERRIRCYALMSGGGVWDRSRDPGYSKAISAFDADNYIGRARPADLLFQSGRRDSIVPRKDMLRFQRLASEPKLIEWYDAGHLLNQAARRDRDAWLARCTKL